VGGVGGGANSSSKAFGISFADTGQRHKSADCQLLKRSVLLNGNAKSTVLAIFTLSQLICKLPLSATTISEARNCQLPLFATTISKAQNLVATQKGGKSADFCFRIRDFIFCLIFFGWYV
jgi:hypothetical protein